MISGGDFAHCTWSAPTAEIALTSAAVLTLPMTVIGVSERWWMGAPAQREQAQRLMAMLAANPDDADTREAARHLVDAYLHDPYLERTPESGL